MRNLPRRLLDNHQALTALYCINLAGVFASSVMNLGDRTFFLFLAGFVGFGWLALRAADRAVDAHIQPRPNPAEFAEDLIPRNHAPATYNVTVGVYGVDHPETLRGLTRSQLLATLAQHGITPDNDAISGRHTLSEGAKHITWGPSTTDITGETR